MYVGKESKIVALIQAKTKISKEDICDIIRVFPEVMAEMIIESDIPENTTLHLGLINIQWQESAPHKPEIVFSGTKRFREVFARLKSEGKTPLSKKLLTHRLNKSLITNK